MAEIVRVNTRISKKLNDWLDKRSKETGYSKSTLVMLAIENYFQQIEVVERMDDMAAVYRELQEIKDKLGE